MLPFQSFRMFHAETVVYVCQSFKMRQGGLADGGYTADDAFIVNPDTRDFRYAVSYPQALVVSSFVFFLFGQRNGNDEVYAVEESFLFESLCHDASHEPSDFRVVVVFQVEKDVCIR